ncbi:ABC transporter substrate-binding protein [[Phormidium ambiguum] IAM M-71]|uniref:ABC transporter substrate-binding protein n=1 Tax=[Phormidium ambiguum] IAM M-71 TaxID=454136 RepID=A0A1U7IM84_9CYAN|nr:metal ABC transporter substrate-binding protein [Phormidium ambiguum]OKH38328.1 ABC transporter substrate-binding protein [Phormidium ambiguum IAM M-71]
MAYPKLPRLFLGLLLGLLTATGCNQSNSVSPPASGVSQTTPQPPKLKVVTTFLPMYWFTKAVTGDLAQVEILVPPGSEIHDYQTTPNDVQAIAQADVLVKNGLGLEEFLKSTIENAQNPKLKQIEASQGIQPLQQLSPVVKPVQKKGNGHDHDHPAGNPHVWLDPVLAIKQVENIRDGLIAADADNKDVYQANAAAYIQQLQALDRQFQQRLKLFSNQCTFITFHDAFPYLAKRYQLKQVAVVEIPEDQLSPDDIQKTIATVKKYNVKALFGESGTDNKLLNSLSQDLNLTLRSLDPLEGGDKDPQYYITGMKSNLQGIEAACR